MYARALLGSTVVLAVASCMLDRSGLDPDASGTSSGAGGGGTAAEGGVGTGGTGGVPVVVPWLTGWGQRRAVTFLARQIEAPGGTALADFPVLVYIAEEDLGRLALPDGADIVFTEADGVTRLDHEIERWDPASAALLAWVRVPLLSSARDTPIYVYYGNAEATPSRSAGTWISDYIMVFHFAEDPGGVGPDDLPDSSGNGHPGTTHNATAANLVPGRIADGLLFDGLSSYVSTELVDPGEAFTVSLWCRAEGVTGLLSLAANSASGSFTNGFRLFVNTPVTQDGIVHFETGNNATTSTASSTAGLIVNGTWSHVVVAADRAVGTAHIYHDGVDVTAAPPLLTDFVIAGGLNIGRMKDGFYHFGGVIDEFRLSRAIRTPEWVRTEFNNQSDPGAFRTVGPPEPAP